MPETDSAYASWADSEAAAADVTALDQDRWSAEPRPWIRYFARSIDVVIAMVMVVVLLTLFLPSWSDSIPSWLFAFAGLFLWIFIEPVFLSRFGATPGKALLGVRVRTSAGENLPYSTALERSGGVWLRGLGLGLPVISMLTMAVAYLHLDDHDRSSWDEELDTYVEHRPMNKVRAAIAVVIVVFVLALRFVGSAL